MTCISVTARRSLSAYDSNTRLDHRSCSQRRLICFSHSLLSRCYYLNKPKSIIIKIKSPARKNVICFIFIFLSKSIKLFLKFDFEQRFSIFLIKKLETQLLPQSFLSSFSFRIRFYKVVSKLCVKTKKSLYFESVSDFLIFVPKRC